MPDATRSEWVIAKTEARAPRAMVVADRPEGTAAGLEILREGGNAVDAAVTAAFAMGVAEPALSGIGGVAAMVIRFPDGRETVIDGSGLAPREATPGMFALADGGVGGMYGWPAVEGDENNVGYRSAGVPGMVAAMALALERYGTIGLDRAVRPAAALGRGGVAIDLHLTLTFASYADRLWRFPESKRTFFKDGGLPLHPPLALEGGGDRLAQVDLARTLETIGREGAEAFYRGTIAQAIVDDVRSGGGLLTLEDLGAYEARELSPLVAEHRGHRVATIPECGGGITAVEMLNVLGEYDLPAMDRRSAPYLHLVAEACRRAFADRFELLGDPAFVDAPFAALASPEHAHVARAEIDPHRASAARVVEAVADAPQTTHICVVDAAGTCVSLTSTLGGAFGSGVVVRGTGIVLANVMTWFDPRPGRPSSVAGGKRILWAPAPAIVSRGRNARLVVGGSGGRRLISGVAQAIVNAVGHGDGAYEAVNGLRVHDEGSALLLDSRAAPAVTSELERMGHRVVPTEETLSAASFGRINAILIDEDGLRGGVNRMRSSVAAGL